MSSVEPGLPAGASPGEMPSPADDSAEDLLDTRHAGPAALRGSALRTVSYVTGIGLSLISVRVLIGHLGVADFGRYVTVLSLVTIVAGFTEGGLNSVVLREYATLSLADRRELTGSVIGIRLVLTSAGVAIAVAFAVVAGYDSREVLGTVLVGVALVIQLLQSTFGTSLQARLRFGWVSVAELVRQVVNVGLLVALTISGAGLLALFAVGIPASLASLAVTMPLVRAEATFRPTFHPTRWWRLMRETIPWAIITAVNIVYFRVSIVLMSVIATAVQTGYFATSFRITEVLVGIPALVIGAAFPILVRAERDDRERFRLASMRIIELSLLAGTWLVMCLEIGAGFAIHLIASHKADPSIAVLRIQGLALIATFVGFACGYPLLTMRRYRAALTINLGALLLSAILTLILVPVSGARGAAVAAVLAELTVAIGCALVLLRSDTGVSFPFSALPPIALAAGAGFAAGSLAPVHAVIGAVLGSAVYFAVLKACGRFPPEVSEMLSSARRRARGRGSGLSAT